MANILLVTSSPRGEGSFSTKVATALAAALEGRIGGTITHRDLAAAPLPHLDGDLMGGMYAPSEAQTPAQAEADARSTKLIAELQAADIIIIAVGMINFSIPSTLKSWIDHVARRGVTFAYVDGAPKGLLTGKKVYLVESYGGIYSDGPMKAHDHLDPYLKFTLGFIGLTDVESLTIEGVAIGPDIAEQAVAKALKNVPVLAQAA